MANDIWAIAEPGPRGDDAGRANEEIATLCRQVGASSHRHVVGLAWDASQAASLASYLPRVLVPDDGSGDTPASLAHLARYVSALADVEHPAYLLLGATRDGRDLAGMLSVLLDWPILTNALSVEWQGGAPIVAVSAFGGRFMTRAAFTVSHGIITVRPGIVEPAPSMGAGSVETISVPIADDVPSPPLVVRAEDSPATGPALEAARVVVAGGRGVGGRDGMRLVEELADALGGAVGATRPPVDDNWIDVSHQIGQTGKVVRPALFVAVGISGEIQHRVGMQASGTIIAVNRDPEAPIAGFADLFVRGDLFEIVPELITLLKAAEHH